ncbi:MAG: hypothetical protein P8X74_20385 [Reinekea sp.]
MACALCRYGVTDSGQGYRNQIGNHHPVKVALRFAGSTSRLSLCRSSMSVYHSTARSLSQTHSKRRLPEPAGMAAPLKMTMPGRVV